MYAYLIVELDKAKLFVDNTKVTREVMEHLKNAGVELRPYESILSEVERFVWDLIFWKHEFMQFSYEEFLWFPFFLSKGDTLL